ncbi:hypothetical protein DCAR_0105055 [Daucus carota subsp. sativus]|uniref:Uncharacterized protein n=1 Tax=Daucus carota subsp. sativus TaxID=79200 RepID=A0AAF1AMF5_DAUCS|nr:hypothetical protein DCAR_0105055 [Daucus carota subsp. sativus]
MFDPDAVDEEGELMSIPILDCWQKLPNMLINCVHPGYTQTELTSKTGPLTPEEGARAPVMLALLPDGGPSGTYFLEMQHQLSTF